MKPMWKLRAHHCHGKPRDWTRWAGEWLQVENGWDPNTKPGRGHPTAKKSRGWRRMGRRSRLNRQLQQQRCGLVSRPQEAIRSSIWRFVMKSSSKRDLKEPTWWAAIHAEPIKTIRPSLMKLNLVCKQMSLNLAILGRNGSDFREKKIMFQQKL